jgi:signal peptidase II
MTTIKKAYYLIVTAIVLALDQFSKELISQSLYLHETRTVIPGFFNLVHTRNSGAVFGFFQNVPSPVLPKILTLLSIAALIFIALFFYRSSIAERMNLLGLSLILGGALGNILDRIFRSSVVDFLEFYVGDFHWPAFNIADSAICVGIFFLILRSLKEGHDPAPATDRTAQQHS